jgi:pimeloyl-ACP methyl ester carboxylesterase
MDARQLPWEPQLLLPGRGVGRVMLLGGFGASPEPLRSLGEQLQAAGADVTIAALARHTGDNAQFFGSRTWHYYAAAAEDLRQLHEAGDSPIVLGGYSTGALVALLLAVTRPEHLAGLVLVSPVLRTAKAATQVVGYSVGSLYYFGLPLAMLASTLAIVAKGRKARERSSRTALRVMGTAAIVAAAGLGLRNVTVPLRSGGPIERHGEMVTPPHFERASLVAGATLVPLQIAARRQLGAVAVPTCVVFGAEDDVVDVAFGVKAASRVATAEVHVVPGAPHRVLAHAACRDIVTTFVERVLGAASTPRAS